MSIENDETFRLARGVAALAGGRDVVACLDDEVRTVDHAELLPAAGDAFSRADVESHL